VAVKKINGFKAPYRSDTFQQQADAQTGRSGVLKMAGAVTQSGGSITVPAFSFIQDGLIVSKDGVTTITAPTMAAPFYLVVSSLTTAQTDDLQFAFAKTPLDLTPTDVIIAAYDGLDWRPTEQVSIDGLLDDVDQANLDFNRTGPFSGLITTVNGGNYQNTAGIVVDKQGQRQKLYSSALFPIIATDPDFSRADKIAYRRPTDSVSRIGVREFLLGGTYSASPALAHATSGVFDSSAPRPRVKEVCGSDNALHLFSAAGYGDSFQLVYKKLAADRTTVSVSAVNVQAMTESAFSVAIDGSNNLHVVFVQSGDIYYRKFGPTGTALTSAILVETLGTPCTAPAVAIDPANSKVFITFQSLLGANNNQIFFTTRDLNGAAITAAHALTATANNLQNPDVVVSADLWVYVAWEDTSTARVWYQTFDDIGSSLAAAVQVSGATTRIGFGTLTDQAKMPKVRVTDNRSVFVTFLQDKGAGVFGLSVWNDGSAFMQQLLTSGESFTTYDVYVDSTFNGVHLILARSSSVDYAKLEGQSLIFSLNLAGSGAASVATLRDALGSMYHLWSETLPATYTTYVTNASITDIGPATLVGTIILLQAVAANQFMILSTAFSSPVPKVGDKVVVSSSTAGNNGTKFITAVQPLSFNTSNDRYLITVDSAFAAAESPGTGVAGTFAEPDGEQADGVKSTSELTALGFRFDSLPTDVLLARIGMPGSHIVGYLVEGQMALDSDAFLVHGSAITIDWGKTTVGSLTLGSGLRILDMVHNVDYAITAGAYVMADATALYVRLDGVNLSPTPLVLPVSALPWADPIQVLGVVKDGEFNPTALMAGAGLGQLDVGEGDIIGEDLPLTNRTRLGITSETTYEAFASTLVIATNDSLPTAISKLDAQVGALENNHPLEDLFLGDGATAQPTFTTAVTGLSWSTSAAVMDISVYVNGRRQNPWSGAGPLLDGQYKKLTTTSFQLAGLVNTQSQVVVRKEGTAYGGPLPPSPGKLWSDQVDSNIAFPDGSFDIAAASNRVRTGFFKNVVLDQLTITGGLGPMIIVKAKTNGDAVTLTAGKPASLYADGKLYKADSDSAQGQRSVGILLDTIAPAAQGHILLFGYNLPGVLTGLGFSPGDEVYISETGTYVNNSSGFTGGDDTIARIGWADCADATASGTATDLIMNYQTISSAP